MQPSALAKFGLFPLRSPLLRESQNSPLISLAEANTKSIESSLICFLFLRVLRCFTSPGSPLPPYCNSGDRYLDSLQVGYPIRKSLDQSLLGGSPRLIAASHVLHRLRLPRYPPSALSTLGHQTFLLIPFSTDVFTCQRTMALPHIYAVS